MVPKTGRGPVCRIFLACGLEMEEEMIDGAVMDEM